MKIWYNFSVGSNESCSLQIVNCGGDRNDDVFTFKKYLNT